MESKHPNGSEQGTPQMDKGSQDLEDQTGLNLKNGQTGKPITRIRDSHNDLTVTIQNWNLDSVRCSESSKSDLAIVGDNAKEQGVCNSNSSSGDTTTDK